MKREKELRRKMNKETENRQKKEKNEIRKIKIKKGRNAVGHKCMNESWKKNSGKKDVWDKAWKESDKKWIINRCKKWKMK